jgi:hypothetical protein
MMKTSKSALRLAVLGISWFVVLLMPARPVLYAQALPAAEASPISTGFALPTTLGSLQYAVSASQSLIWGYYGNSGVAASTNVSGDIAYLSNSKLHPFSLVFSGGEAFSESGQSSYSFLNLGFSQVANVGRWNLVVSDNVSYLPGTATAGLSGVPGVGDLGVSPVQVGAETGQGVLTDFSNRVNNIVAGSVSRQLTGKTSINASGSYGIMRFLSSSNGSESSSSAGLDSDSSTGAGGISHQVNARNSFGGNYSYSQFSYSPNSLGIPTEDFASQTVSAVFSHQFTRKFGINASAGPQWTKVDNSSASAGLSLFADGSASYAGKATAASLTFVRSSNSGYGVIGGAISSSASFAASRRFALVWNCTFVTSYTQTSSLPGGASVPYSVDTTVGGLQVSRAIARSLSAYASYNLEDQHSAGSAVDVFTGLSQVVGFGITYSPASLHLGRQ